MAKKANAVRVNISVPSDLKRRMDKARDINWSAVAAQSFEGKLLEIAQRKKGLDMESVRERLLASKQEGNSESYEHGHACGTDWAKTEAKYNELKRLKRLRDSLQHEHPNFDDSFSDGSSIQWSGGGPEAWLASEILGPEAEEECWSYKDFMDILWIPVFGSNAEDVVEDLQVLRGFCCGAIEVFEEAAI